MEELRRQRLTFQNANTDRDKARDALSAAKASHQATLDQVRRSYLATAAPNKNEIGELTGFVFSFVDVTERRAAEATIRREAEVQMKEAESGDGFAGHLNILSLVDVFQLIESTARTGSGRSRQSRS